jgi:hypothetical protein
MKFCYTAAEFCTHIAKLFKQVTPIAGKGIKIEDTDNGKRISCTVEPVNNGGSASVEYKGYFKVVTGDTEGTIKIINGADEESAIAGIFSTGGQNIGCPVAELTVDDAGVVYAHSWFEEGEYHVEFIFNSAVLEVDREVFIPLASINSDLFPAQIWTDGTINMDGKLVT